MDEGKKSTLKMMLMCEKLCIDCRSMLFENLIMYSMYTLHAFILGISLLFSFKSMRSFVPIAVTKDTQLKNPMGTVILEMVT